VARLGSAPFFRVQAQGGDNEANPNLVRFGSDWARLLIRQALRPDARRVLDHLRRQGLKLAILSGDRPEAVAPIARELGVEDWRGGLKPAEKIAFIEQLAAKGAKVLMVGDGLNDAPALAAAHASISPIDAVHLTQTQADAVFLGERLAPVAAAIAIARRARRLMRENLTLAIGYNAIAVPVAILGHASPLFAALAMSGSSILVTLNALRLRGPGKEATLLLRDGASADRPAAPEVPPRGARARAA
jgi:Cu2+-exporting ATPase